MKTIRLLSITSLWLIISCFLIISCEKHSEIPPPQKPKMLSKTTNWGICCVWNGVDDCVPPKVNCFEEIVITPNDEILAQAIDDLDDAILQGANAIKEFFDSGSWGTIWPDLDADEGENASNIDYLEKLQSGNYTMKKITETPFYYYLSGEGTTWSNSEAEFVLVLKDDD